MGRATWANIEQQAQEFVDYSLMPYVKQWEETLKKKLLTDAEKKTYNFRINVMALLRGDSAARSAFYRSLFDMGALSPNDIRELEDWNPVDDGDQYFVPANNLVPLGSIADMAQANIDRAEAEAEKAEAEAEKVNEPPPVVTPPPVGGDDGIDAEDVTDLIAAAAVKQAKADEAVLAVKEAIQLSVQARIDALMQHESHRMLRAAKKPETFLAWRDEFYAEFRGKLAAELSPYAAPANRVGMSFSSAEIADAYVAESLASLEPLADLGCKEFEAGVAGLVESWNERPARYAAGALKERETPCAI
jgi:hypothetical protein